MKFNGQSISLPVSVTVKESIFGSESAAAKVYGAAGFKLEKEIAYSRQVKCPTCNGTRESTLERGPECYSCQGTGIKKDPLFHKE
mmetsp:Transcript_17750/g.27444  ORF Transcript_17750/g.27444 Transcript_17750/m.27444 type:complete len:85 (+) Transcript_17750:615-869(+)